MVRRAVAITVLGLALWSAPALAGERGCDLVETAPGVKVRVGTGCTGQQVPPRPDTSQKPQQVPDTFNVGGFQVKVGGRLRAEGAYRSR